MSLTNIKGNNISSAAPSAGQVLAWNGTQWAPAAAGGGGATVGAFGARPAPSPGATFYPTDGWSSFVADDEFGLALWPYNGGATTTSARIVVPHMVQV